MFAGISLIINSKAAGMSKTMRYTQIQDLIKYNYYTEICEIKFHDFNKTFPGLEVFHDHTNPVKSNWCTLSITKDWSSPSSNHMPDPLLTCFIPGPLNLQIKHWATLLKVLLLTDLCFVSLMPCPFSEHISPARLRRAASGSRCSVLY